MYPSVANHRLFSFKLPTAKRSSRLLSEWNFHFLVSSFWWSSDYMGAMISSWMKRRWSWVLLFMSVKKSIVAVYFPDWELGLGFGDGGSFVKKKMKNEGFLSTRARHLVFFSAAVIASLHTRKLCSASARSWEKPSRSFTMRAKVWLPLLLPICCFLSVSLLLSSSVSKLWDRVPRARRVFEVCVWCVWFDGIDLRFLLSLCGSVLFFCIWVAFSA